MHEYKNTLPLYLYFILFCCVAPILFILNKEKLDKESNVRTCKVLGEVTDTSCAVYPGKHTTLRCRVNIKGKRMNLPYRFLVIEGDIIEHCTNSSRLIRDEYRIINEAKQ